MQIMVMSDIWYCRGGPGEHDDHNIHQKVMHALSSVSAVQYQLHQARQPELGIWLEYLYTAAYAQSQGTIQICIHMLHT